VNSGRYLKMATAPASSIVVAQSQNKSRERISWIQEKLRRHVFGQEMSTSEVVSTVGLAVVTGRRGNSLFGLIAAVLSVREKLRDDELALTPRLLW
jgi:hypothetical protein